MEGVRGFIPASKLSLHYVEDLEEYLNQPIQVRVFEVDKAKKRLILSAKEILREKAEEERRAKVSNVQVGLVTEGTVESIKPYGAFVDLGNGLSGLVHISQVSEKRIKDCSSVLSVGDKVKVKVIAIKDGKLSLSMKALADVAAKEIEEETYELPKAGEATTSLGSLFANIKLDAINEQISNFAQTYPTNLKASSNEALLFMRRYRFANCSCFSCCFKDSYPSSNVQ